tara:strand:- start:2535 stop:2786 length:252 start_codon:yes stop_codon:yes gene_type:complete
MKTTYKMKEALDVKEAKISILDVMEENPLWLNKVTNSLSILLKNIEPEHRKFLLDKSLDEQVLDLYVKIKSEYYIFKDNTQWS